MQVNQDTSSLQGKKIYVAGRVTDIENVQKVQTICVEKEMLISFDWTRSLEGEIYPEEYWDDHKEIAQKLAVDEIKGVKHADALVAVHQNGTGLGKYIEIGVAISLNIPVILIGDFRKHLFWHLPNVYSIKTSAQLIPQLLTVLN